MNKLYSKKDLKRLLKAILWHSLNQERKEQVVDDLYRLIDEYQAKENILPF